MAAAAAGGGGGAATSAAAGAAAAAAGSAAAMASDDGAGPASATDVLLELLETAFHMLLFVREIYPARLFEKRRRYGVPVQMARHPQLCQYITDILQAIRPWVTSGSLASVMLVVTRQDMKPIERFVFDLGLVPPEPLLEAPAGMLERYLRAIILKLSMVDSILKPVPPDCTFAIHVTAKSEATVGSELLSMPWIMAGSNETSMVEGDPATSLDPAPTLHPLKRADLGLFALDVYAEEAVDRKPRSDSAPS